MNLTCTKNMGSPLLFVTFLCTLISLSSYTSISTSIHTPTHTLSPNQNLTDGLILLSSNQRFALGFFSPDSSSSSRRYLGIWYYNLPLTVVWLANKNNPIANSFGRLTLTNNGVLILYNGSTGIVWSTNGTTVAKSPIMQLLDSGNLVISVDDVNNNVWQSFDYMCDTLLPGMKLGWKLDVGLNRYVRSWKSNEDPSDGEFSFSLDPPESPQLVLRKGSQKQYRWGPFDGNRFSGSNELRANPVFKPMFVYNSDEVYYRYEMLDDSVLSRFVVTPLGFIQYFTWRVNSSTEWSMMITLNRDYCDRYAMCGPYGSCYADDPKYCRCLDGLTPRSPRDWSLLDWTQGCKRRHELNCSHGDGFVKYNELKLPDNSTVWVNYGHEECAAKCLSDCGCMAYTNIDVHGNGSRCVVWLGHVLVDIRNFPNGGEEIYIRMARAELESIADAKRRRRAVKIRIIVIATVLGVLLFIGVCLYISRINRVTRKGKTCPNSQHSHEESQDNGLELPLIDLETIFVATDNFSTKNKIGEGGFGPVYKGKFPNEQEIAVKRLSEKSVQGLQELKNEVILIAQLQHRNLVKLLGCCLQGEERILVYEYLPNKSLDNFIYDRLTRKLMQWKTRLNIVMGIARGLLYLHQDSNLRIIHRDLKTSNILLDREFNPKISDFGIARIFGGDQTQEKTKRVIGTYGYMSPEYAMSGRYSVKSDVFSFGVIVLEIISGQKNWVFHHPDHDLNLVGHAWKLWNEGVPMEIMDPMVDEPLCVNEVVRCIQVALLCVQQHAKDRPTMSSVVSMFSNESMGLPQPKEPGFCRETSIKVDSCENSQSTANEVTITTMLGR